MKALVFISVTCILASAAVVGIDLGGGYYKSVLVSSGEPFRIVENTSSKRKTPTAICFTEEERVFESDAVGKSNQIP